jgi:hypothetical protein
VHRLWTQGVTGSEYFLRENRQQTGYNSKLPSSGLLIWHDESQPDNSDENHYKVGLLQADGRGDLESDHNRGDSGDTGALDLEEAFADRTGVRRTKLPRPLRMSSKRRARGGALACNAAYVAP